MEVTKTNIEGVLLVKPRVFRDNRGFFSETYSKKLYSSHGLKENFVQDNFSHSSKGTLRGLHYQLQHPQGKLVRVTRGSVFDVAVDIRKHSKTYGKYFSVTLDDLEFKQLYMPPGIAHGFCVMSDEVDFEYKCTDYYYPDDQHGISWNDPSLGIEWPISNPILSAQDNGFLGILEINKSKLPGVEIKL